MKIFFNDQPLDIEGIGDDTTVMEVVDLVQAEIRESGLSLTEIQVDEKSFDLEDKDELQKIAVFSTETVHLWGTNVQTMIKSAVKDVEEVFAHLESISSEVSEGLRVGRVTEAMEKYLGLLEGLTWISSILKNIVVGFPDQMVETDLGRQREDLIARFSKQTKALEEAQDGQDWVGMADIIEYELVEVYRESHEFIAQFNKE